MHIAILADFAVASGGAEKVAIESARALAEAGAHVTYIHAVTAEPDRLLDHPRLRRVDLGLADVWTRPAVAAAREGIWSREAARRLKDALALARPELVHLHQWTRALSPSVFPVLTEGNRPLVVTLHDYFAACPNGVYYRFDRQEPCRLRPLSPACLVAPCDPRSRLHKAVRVLRSVATRRAISSAARPIELVHVSDRSRAILTELLAGLPVRHHRVDNPVRATPAPPAAPGPDAAVAFIGRLTREKGADLVAAAAEAAGTAALFIGSGPLEAELRARPGVEVLGWRSPAEVEAILRSRVRALVAPSRWNETGPLTVYEALAAGVPAVVSDRAGAAEKVAHGETGFVVAPALSPLAAAFRALGDDAVVRRMGGEAHRRYWAAPLTAGVHAERLGTLYAEVMAARAGSP